MKTPKVSILIPVYNTEAYIGETIESVLKQTFKDFELVIVDDCSTDNTFSICEKYAREDSRIKLFKNTKNLGMMPNWNHGITLCNQQSTYWGKLDADDWWHEKMLEDCVNILDSSKETGMVCSRYVCIDEHSNLIANSEYSFPDFAKNQAISFISLVKEGIHKMLSYCIAQQGIGLLRMEFFKKYGNYLLIQPADTELYFRIGANYLIHCLDELRHYHRIWAGSDTRATILNNFGKMEKNLFDVRNAILDYYYQNKKISESEYKSFSKDNNYEYKKFLVYKYRREKKYIKMLSMLRDNFLTHPKQAIQFYFSRFKSH